VDILNQIQEMKAGDIPDDSKNQVMAQIWGFSRDP
jgi:hypothetical protein